MSDNNNQSQTPTRDTEKSKEDYIVEAKQLAQLLQDMDVSEPDLGPNDDDPYKRYLYSSNISSIDRNSHFVWLVSSTWFQLWKDKTNFDNLENGLDIDENSITDDILPVLNEDLLDQNVDESLYTKTDEKKFSLINTICRPGLVEMQDFVMVSRTVWEFIQGQYPDAIEVKRIAYKIMGDMKYEINLTPIYWYVFSNEKLKWFNEDKNNYLQRRRI